MANQEMSQRQRRFGEIVRHALADIFYRDELQDPEYDFRLITVF